MTTKQVEIEFEKDCQKLYALMAQKPGILARAKARISHRFTADFILPEPGEYVHNETTGGFIIRQTNQNDPWRVKMEHEHVTGLTVTAEVHRSKGVLYAF